MKFKATIRSAILLFLGISILGCIEMTKPNNDVETGETIPVVMATTTLPNHSAVVPPLLTTSTIDEPSMLQSSVTTTVITTPLAQPTMSENEQNRAIEERIRLNSGCELPCWWGIVPGETKLSQAQAALSTFRTAIRDNGNAIDLSYSYPNVISQGASPEVFVSFFTFFSDESSTINLIRVGSQSSQGSVLSHGFDLLWDAYSPKKFVSSMGKPNRVFLSSTAEECSGNACKQGFEMWLLYDTRGVMIRYEGIIDDAKTYHYCPDFGEKGNIVRFYLFLQSPKDTIPLEKRDEMWVEKLLPIVSFEKATGTTLDDFYRVFSQDQERGCFNVPRKVWEN